MMSLSISLQRCIRILRVSVRHVATHYLRTIFAKWPRLLQRLPGRTLAGPERLRTAFEEIGGTFIKFGQMLALQSDLLPLEYCRALFTLFDRVPPFAFAEVQKIFFEELGRGPYDVYDSFDPNPIATGSIGQVHRASLGTE